MKRESVRSSTIRSVGYDPVTGTLEVEFVTGDVYTYSDVPSHLHQWLMAVGSKGGFFNKHVRDRYLARRVHSDV